MSALNSVKILWLVLFLGPFCHCQDRPCPSSSPCTVSSSCAWYKQFSRLSRTNRTEYERRLSLVRDAVCNKQLKKICCPQDDTSGTYLPSPGQCGGESLDFGVRVIGGEETSPGDFPFNALLGYREKCKREGREELVRCIKFLCGGSLINRRYVLTAGHCHSATVAQLVLGEWDVSTTEDCERAETPSRKCLSIPLPPVQKFRISSNDVVVHPEFVKGVDGNLIVNDIALVRLPRLAELNKGTQLVCLPLNEASSSVFGLPNWTDGLLSKTPTVVGWGHTTSATLREALLGGPRGDFNTGKGNVASNTPQKLSHGLVSSGDPSCRRYNLMDSQICGAGAPGRAACSGDSGSGLHLNGSNVEVHGGAPWVQVGLVSYGRRTCDDNTVYTRISSFIPWIQENLKP